MNDHFVILGAMVAKSYRQWPLAAIAKVVMLADSSVCVERKGETEKLGLTLRLHLVI